LVDFLASAGGFFALGLASPLGPSMARGLMMSARSSALRSGHRSRMMRNTRSVGVSGGLT
jgi:hypothetical protein